MLLVVNVVYYYGYFLLFLVYIVKIVQCLLYVFPPKCSVTASVHKYSEMLPWQPWIYKFCWVLPPQPWIYKFLLSVTMTTVNLQTIMLCFHGYHKSTNTCSLVVTKTTSHYKCSCCVAMATINLKIVLLSVTMLTMKLKIHVHVCYHANQESKKYEILSYWVRDL